MQWCSSYLLGSHLPHSGHNIFIVVLPNLHHLIYCRWPSCSSRTKVCFFYEFSCTTPSAVCVRAAVLCPLYPHSLSQLLSVGILSPNRTSFTGCTGTSLASSRLKVANFPLSRLQELVDAVLVAYLGVRDRHPGRWLLIVRSRKHLNRTSATNLEIVSTI
jgi:hypothetical protein